MLQTIFCTSRIEGINFWKYYYYLKSYEVSPAVGSDYRYYMMIYLVCLNMNSVVVQFLAFQML